MELKCKINGEEVTLRAEPTARLRDVLYRAGYRSVRDSDDAEGFAGSDTIVFNGKLKYANFILFYQAEGAEIRTAEGLLNGRELNYVQKAMVAAGIVQSAYNAPAAALILTWLLEQKPNPTREEIKDVLTSIFIRDAGYEHYYLAVKLATELRDFGEFRSEIAPSFRPSLEVVGKPCGKIDGAALVSGEPVFVEDKVPENAWCLHVLRSPFASAYIKSIDTSEAEKLPGVAAILTAYNTPETHYMQAGQGNPEPSPHDRRLFNRKVRHVGDRVAPSILPQQRLVGDLIENGVTVCHRLGAEPDGVARAPLGEGVDKDGKAEAPGKHEDLVILRDDGHAGKLLAGDGLERVLDEHFAVHLGGELVGAEAAGVSGRHDKAADPGRMVHGVHLSFSVMVTLS